jgi:hypothetical protein
MDTKKMGQGILYNGPEWLKSNGSNLDWPNDVSLPSSLGDQFGDTDRDGIHNLNDAFPEDPTRISKGPYLPDPTYEMRKALKSPVIID